MIIKEESVTIDTATGPMYTYIFRPATDGVYPGIVMFSEIYQVTGPIKRVARFLAGNGYVVAAPEVYHEFEPPCTPFAYDKDDTDKGNKYKIEKDVAAYDSDARAVLSHLKSRPDCTGRLGSFGICLGGHLSFRAAMNPEVQAAGCFYATDIHTRTLGKGMNDDSLDRLKEIHAELLLVWGRQDPHVPREGRKLLHHAITEAGIHFSWHEFNAQHAFIRDEGYRYDPALAGLCLDMLLELFHRRLQLGHDDPSAPKSDAGAPSC